MSQDQTWGIHPSLVCPWGEAQFLAGYGLPCTGGDRLLYQLDQECAIGGAGQSSSSCEDPQIASAFFRSTSIAAVSASADSLR